MSEKRLEAPCTFCEHPLSFSEDEAITNPPCPGCGRPLREVVEEGYQHQKKTRDAQAAVIAKFAELLRRRREKK